MTEDDKNRIIKDSVENFNEHVNPGWLTYRKSVSTDAAFVEWEDSQETFRDTHGKEFIDCLGGFGIYTAGHRNPEIVAAVQAQLNRYALHSQELVDPYILVFGKAFGGGVMPINRKAYLKEG